MNASVRRSVVALAAGAGIGLCWLPGVPAWLYPIPFAAMMAALRSADTPRQALAVGGMFGLGTYSVGGHFLFVLTRHSPFAAVFFFLLLGYGCSFTVAAARVSWGVERATGLSRTTSFALLYVAFEGIRTWGTLSFPADLVGHAFGPSPSWLAPAVGFGPHAMAVWALGVAWFLDRGIHAPSRGKRRAASLTVALALFVVPVAVDRIGRPHGDGAHALRVGIVQPFVRLAEKFDPRRHEAIWERLAGLSENVADDVDVVVWPESARPRPVVWDDRQPFADERMDRLARRLGVPILYGCEIARVRGDRFVALYNGAAVAYPDGRPGDWYGKQRLLPFAEGMPLGAWFGWDPFPDGGGDAGSGGALSAIGKFSPGPRATLFEIAGERIGVLICYEGMYPRLAATYRRSGATALAVLTNDLWWGRSVFPRWHANQARTLARSTGVSVLRAANAGISGAYRADGTVAAETELMRATSAVVEVPRGATSTPLSAWLAPWVPWIAFLAWIGAAVVLRGRRTRATSR